MAFSAKGLSKLAGYKQQSDLGECCPFLLGLLWNCLMAPMADDGAGEPFHSQPIAPAPPKGSLLSKDWQLPLPRPLSGISLAQLLLPALCLSRPLLLWSGLPL